MTEVTTITEPDELAALGGEWDALVLAMRRPSPFLLHGWLVVWWRHHAERGSLTVHVAREGDRLELGLANPFEPRRARHS